MMSFDSNGMEEFGGGTRGAFQETDWEMVRAGGEGDLWARGELARRYEKPLRAYAWRAWELRRYAFPNAEGKLDGDELWSGFLSEVFHTEEFLRKADREKGRFRSYVLGAMTHYVIDQGLFWQRQKRGGELHRVGEDYLLEQQEDEGLSPAEACDQQMLLDALGWAARKVRADWMARGNGRLVEALLGLALRDLDAGEGLRERVVAAQLGISARMVPHHKRNLRVAHAAAVREYLCATCGAEYGRQIFRELEGSQEAFRAFLKRRSEAAKLKKGTRKSGTDNEDCNDVPAA